MNKQTQEALKMAIEALEQAKEQLEKYWDEDINRGYDIEEMDDSPILLCGDTINVCKEALEQPDNMVAVPADKLEKMQKELKRLRKKVQAVKDDEINRSWGVFS
jgi:septation ring formation regulator EzrA